MCHSQALAFGSKIRAILRNLMPFLYINPFHPGWLLMQKNPRHPVIKCHQNPFLQGCFLVDFGIFEMCWPNGLLDLRWVLMAPLTFF